jgi:iron complex transport system permease protein
LKATKERFSFLEYALFTLALIFALLLCLCVGSVPLPLSDTLRALWRGLWGQPLPDGVNKAILFSVRLPRVICVALSGAALSLCGAAMQGLLRNPLADGSTLGVSAGASLGAVIALAFGVAIPGLPYAGTMGMAMAFAFASLLLILSLAYALDRSFSTHSIILIGVIFSMFASALMSLVISFAGERIKSITFWTMGSLAGSNMDHALILLLALALCGGVLLRHTRELNAFAVGEDNARNVGVDVRRVKLTVLITVSVLIGVCVSIGGTISFVGLVTPHMARMLAGPNHKRLLPASMFLGAVFLLLSDLAARTLLSPIELSIGVVTSLVGAVAFVIIFRRTRKGG